MKNLNIELYKKIYLIRAAEIAIQDYYFDDDMKTPMHMSMGEEAIAAGVCAALRPEDQILGTYRSHGIYLAKTMETDLFFAEMFGRVTGTSKGKAGSMHLIAPEHEFICSSAIVASHIPVALGAAFANKIHGNSRFVVVFFGDGAIDEGVFWESINFSCLKKLPVLFVCEDNSFAVHTPASSRHGFKSLSKIIKHFECNFHSSDTTDAEIIFYLTKNMLESIEQEKKPGFLHLKYYRYLEHVGVSQDFKAGYRSEGEFRKWYRFDPVLLQRNKLLEELDENEIIKIEKEIKSQVKSSIYFAKNSPFPNPNQVLYEDLYQ